jgi:hypothetical protein
VFRKQPTRCDQQPFDGPKTNFPKDRVHVGSKIRRAVSTWPDEESVTYLRILGLLYVELTMSCYFKLCFANNTFIASLNRNELASRIISTCASKAYLLLIIFASLNYMSVLNKASYAIC